MGLNFSFGVLVAGIALVSGTIAAAAAEGSLLGTWKNWSAYSTTMSGKQVCYILSSPRDSLPKGVRRGAIYFLVNDWPDRHVKAEVEIVAGYPYKPGVPVEVEIGSDKFTFFSRDSGDNGNAWVQSLSDGARVVAAMQKGASMLVTGTSTRGTVTKDTYALDGFADALAKMHATCKM